MYSLVKFEANYRKKDKNGISRTVPVPVVAGVSDS